MLHNRILHLAAAAAAVMALAGCGKDELQRDFGLTRDAPDEFVVTTRAPLSMPPDFSLRPPRPGETRPQEQTQSQQAEATLVPQAALAPAPGTGTDAAPTPGQEALLAAAGPPAPPDVRQKVDQEAARESSDRSLTDQLLFWKTPPQPGVVVDASKESQRLRQNAALGQSPDAGETPTIQNKPKGFLDWLF
jgi:hypothetical protein